MLSYNTEYGVQALAKRVGYPTATATATAPAPSKVERPEGAGERGDGKDWEGLGLMAATFLFFFSLPSLPPLSVSPLCLPLFISSEIRLCACRPLLLHLRPASLALVPSSPPRGGGGWRVVVDDICGHPAKRQRERDCEERQERSERRVNEERRWTCRQVGHARHLQQNPSLPAEPASKQQRYIIVAGQAGYGRTNLKARWSVVGGGKRTNWQIAPSVDGVVVMAPNGLGGRWGVGRDATSNRPLLAEYLREALPLRRP